MYTSIYVYMVLLWYFWANKQLHKISQISICWQIFSLEIFLQHSCYSLTCKQCVLFYYNLKVPSKGFDKFNSKKTKQKKETNKKTFVFTLCCILTELAFTTHTQTHTRVQTHTHSHRVPAWQTSPVNWACKSCAQHQNQWRNIHHLQHWPDSASL